MSKPQKNSTDLSNELKWRLVVNHLNYAEILKYNLVLQIFQNNDLSWGF